MADENLLCPLKHLAVTFGGKWKLPIICILSADNSPKRYSMIKRRLGNVTNMMLSQSLHELEASGLIHREHFNEIPPHVEYSLTERGKETLTFLSEATKWATEDLSRNGIKIFCGECVNIH